MIISGTNLRVRRTLAKPWRYEARFPYAVETMLNDWGDVITKEELRRLIQMTQYERNMYRVLIETGCAPNEALQAVLAKESSGSWPM